MAATIKVENSFEILLTYLPPSFMAMAFHDEMKMGLTTHRNSPHRPCPRSELSHAQPPRKIQSHIRLSLPKTIDQCRILML